MAFWFEMENQRYINSIDIYPPGIDNIVNYWFAKELEWKSIYVRAWCLNGYLMMVIYFIYLLNSDIKAWIDKTKSTSYLMLIAMIIFGFYFGWSLYSGWIFSPARILSDQIKKMLYEDFNLLVFFPIFWVFSSLFIMFSMMFSVALVVKFFHKYLK
jgi:hypothetical protein